MSDQLDGFDYVKIEYGRRFYAYNSKSDYVVFWLGSDEDEETMRARITGYGSPSYMVTRSFTRQEALSYYIKAKKANERAMVEELERTKDRPEPQYAERFSPLEKWRYQPRF